MTLQDRIVMTARGWLGTRFHHQGRIKKTTNHKGGVDCLGLLVGVAHELGLHSPSGVSLSTYDERNYPHYPDHQRLRNMLSGLMSEVKPTEMQPGDVVLLNIDGLPQHMGILTQMQHGVGIIHAYAPARGVVEHLLDSWWRERIEAVFRITP